MKTIVWACFWDYRRTGLYIINRDFEAKKHSYSTNSYLEVLDAKVKPLFDAFDEEEDNEGYVFI